MKSLLILVLVFALCAATFATRPSQADVATYLKSQTNQGSGLSLKGLLQGIQADAYLKSMIFHDRLLYTSVEQNGQTRYIGAFNHWFNQTAPAATSSK